MSINRTIGGLQSDSQFECAQHNRRGDVQQAWGNYQDNFTRLIEREREREKEQERHLERKRESKKKVDWWGRINQVKHVISIISR